MERRGSLAEHAAGATEWSDTRLVRECIRGNEEAWGALIDKYKRLIFSIPMKYGAFRQRMRSDVFQNVCLDLLSELPKLREPKALPKWIMQVTRIVASGKSIRRSVWNRRRTTTIARRRSAPDAERILVDARPRSSRCAMR